MCYVVAWRIRKRKLRKFILRSRVNLNLFFTRSIPIYHNSARVVVIDLELFIIVTLHHAFHRACNNGLFNFFIEKFVNNIMILTPKNSHLQLQQSHLHCLSAHAYSHGWHHRLHFPEQSRSYMQFMDSFSSPSLLPIPVHALNLHIYYCQLAT